MMTDTNGHSNDVEDDRDGDSGGGQKLMELLNSQLQNAVKLEERYNNLKKQYDSLLKTKNEVEDRNTTLKKQHEDLNQKFVEVLNEKKELEELSLERLQRAEEEKKFLEERGSNLAVKVEDIRAATEQLQLRLKETDTNLQHTENKVVQQQDSLKRQKERNNQLTEENIKLREEVRWGKEKEERTTRANEKLQAELQEAKMANEVLAKQNEDWKAQLASEADNNKKLWALLEDVKNMKSQVIAETETSLFATTIEEQKKQIQDLKKENKLLKKKLTSIVTNVTERLSKPTTEDDLKSGATRTVRHPMTPSRKPEPSNRGPSNYFQVTPKKPSSVSLPTTPARPASPHVSIQRPIKPSNDLLLLDYLEKKDTPPPAAVSRPKSGLATTSQRPLDFKSAELTKTEEAEDSEDEKEEKEVDKNKPENREAK